MKFSTLCLLASVVLCSCQDEGYDNPNAENIFKKRPKTGDLHLPGDNNNGNGNTTQTQQIPFDLGLSAVMGAGAIVAIRRARQRRKEETR